MYFHQLHYGYAPSFLTHSETIMSNADDFQDRLVRVERLSPSHTARISVFPYTSPLGNCSQDVSPPSVIRITPFPFVTYVQTHYPEMFLPILFRHLQHGQCLCFTQERVVGTNNTPYPYTPKGRLCLVTPPHPSREIRYLSPHTDYSIVCG